MKLLFVADALATFKPYKDSTFAMMREAQQRGFEVFHCTPEQLSWRSAEPVQAQVTPIALKDHAEQLSAGDVWWESLSSTVKCPLKDFSAVLMRKDPPFDAEYIYATHLLEAAERDGARVFNKPEALRNHPEKLALMQFSQWAPATLVTRQDADIRAFHRQHGDIILKPLDGMGGMGIFRVKSDGLNLGSIIETLNQQGAQTVMVQAYLPAIEQGDKRVLLIGGEAVPYGLSRIPQHGEVRGNLAVGGKGVAHPLTPTEWEMARTLGPVLAQRGLLLVGLDVIGDKLTEVNVTSPTCFQEITQQTGFPVASMFIDALVKQLERSAV